MVGFPCGTAHCLPGQEDKGEPQRILRPHRVHPHHEGTSEPRGTDTACRNPLRRRGLEKGFSVRLPDRTAEERHQAAHLAADTAVHQRQDVRDHPYAEDEADCTQPHQ